MSALDEIKSEIAQLTETVKNHKGDTAVLDSDKLAASLQGLVDKQVADRLEQAERNRPARRGEIIGPPGFAAPSAGIVPTGKWAGMAVDDLIFTNWLLSKASKLQPDKVKAPSKELMGMIEKALGSTTAGAGDEYVPTGMAASLWEDMFLASKVVGTLGTVPMPTNPFDMPLGWGAITWRKGTQGVGTASQDPSTAKSTLTATEQVAELTWNYDLDEDAIIAVLPTLRSEVSRSAADQMDAFVLNADSTNADTGNINMDDANPDDDAYYLSDGQDGIRHLYLVDNTGQSTDVSAALDDAKMRAGISRLGKYAADVSQLAMVTDAKTYVNNMLALSNVLTIDKFGPQATILTGELAKYSGIPIVVSAVLPEAGDDGKVCKTAASNDEGQIAFFHRPSWRVGFRRQLLIELDRSIQRRQFIMVVSFRIAIATRGTRSTATHTSGIHGIVRN